jgi:5-methyltetrahydropteroyltriglutamate--homocysteine methyltransferase
MTTGTTPAAYRADHVGSLLRPPELLQARREHAAGRLSATDLRRLEDACILRALAMQRATGIDVLSDGEYRRSSWMEAWGRVLAPFEVADTSGAGANANVGRWRGRGEALVAQQAEAAPPRRFIGKRVQPERVEPMTAHEVEFLRQHADGSPFKNTMPGVGHFAGNAFRPGVTDRVYRTRMDMVRDLAVIQRRELEALIARGVPYVQLDSLRYVLQLADPDRRAALRAAGIDPDQDLDDTIAADNLAVGGMERNGSVVALHMCRGNNRSTWAAQGSYDVVAEKTFGQLQVDRFLLEYDDERSGGFEPLRFVPPNTMVVLGLISSKVPELESTDDLRRRIDGAARYHPLDRLALSPQCGFASTEGGNLLSWDEQRRKLELVAETARLVWG